MNPSEFRRLGHLLVDWIADYHTRVGTLPVMSKASPGDIRAALPSEAPQEPEPIEDVLRDVDSILLPGLTSWQHPSFFGYFPSAASPASAPRLTSTASYCLLANWVSWACSIHRT